MIGKNDVWFITGCSRGLGRALAVQALRSGYRVVATARRKDDLADLADGQGKLLAVELDVTKPDEIAAAIAAAQERFGSVDVLVNNAGYGYFASIEEGVDAEVRDLMETDVFGPLNLVKAVLPGMRERGHGYVINISSIGGFVTFPAVGYYHMAKFALEGMTETLAKEVRPFGIGVTIVAPGAFRTDFRRPESAKQSSVRIPAYAETAGKARDGIFAAHGKQRGDPMRGARAIIAAVEADDPPMHLVIGGDALDQAREKIAQLQREFDAWEALSRDTDFQDRTQTDHAG
ncbi:oxidoreductase [Burkholderia sp. MSMB2157WGS]|uniref:oxidoreductase n=1 Tax=Burkholderia sp. MSMB2157WGS TaxID=1637928 RepID=UPI0007562DE4|nr:oxidoreductase [Burkholderia sp. MSMB2157WGS]KWE61685.1 short-chain dehydrogenase [Burkholderia sp. MSMB2157WGS]